MIRAMLIVCQQMVMKTSFDLSVQVSLIAKYRIINETSLIMYVYKHELIFLILYILNLS